MQIQINTRSLKYQNYMEGLSSLRSDMLPQLKAFKALSKERQKWWLQRDPLLRRLVKLSFVIRKHIPDIMEREVEND